MLHKLIVEMLAIAVAMAWIVFIIPLLLRPFGIRLPIPCWPAAELTRAYPSMGSQPNVIDLVVLLSAPAVGELSQDLMEHLFWGGPAPSLWERVFSAIMPLAFYAIVRWRLNRDNLEQFSIRPH